MNSTTIPVCSGKQYSYDILGDLKVEVTVESNPYNIGLGSLFAMAARRNAKRGFLFVSKVLGKHIPVHPLTPLIGGAALAQRYADTLTLDVRPDFGDNIAQALNDTNLIEKVWQAVNEHFLILPEPTLIIGFAETATALGHAMFSRFEGEVSYIHTTRENIPDISNILEFTEEHSHAPEHRCYPLNACLFNNKNTIVLVDDEITTGKSALNFIKAIQAKYPRRKYAVVSLLDWRSPAQRQEFSQVESQLGIEITTVALVSGQISVQGKPVLNYQSDAEAVVTEPVAEQSVDRMVLPYRISAVCKRTSVQMDGLINATPYLLATGRFGLDSQTNKSITQNIKAAGEWLRGNRRGNRTLCLGTGEFMYLPFVLASYMGKGVTVQSTTRSPIHAVERIDYAVQNAVSFTCPSDPAVDNYLYNVLPDYYDEVFVLLERQVADEQLTPLLRALRQLNIPRVCLVTCLDGLAGDCVERPQPMGSYSAADVIFLLKDISNAMAETATEDREEAIQSGTHYSEMLPKEYRPTEDYIKLFHATLAETAEKVALAAAIVAEAIIKQQGPNVVLVSLARAGTPIGILIKRYLKERYKLNVPHYSISIIRGKGVDENALLYILREHPEATIQFIDGWTGKGAITRELLSACESFSLKYGKLINSDLAVLADPGDCVKLYGTREDFLIPSACLNSTVSGLVSRTVHRSDLIGPYDFHAAKYYREWEHEDVSNLFVDTIAAWFTRVAGEGTKLADRLLACQQEPLWEGLKKIQQIQRKFDITDINLIKPGVGETTRVLLRRVPWRILVDSFNNPNLRHILLLAHDRGVTVEEWPGLSYSCCGIIKPVGR